MSDNSSISVILILASNDYLLKIQSGIWIDGLFLVWGVNFFSWNLDVFMLWSQNLDPTQTSGLDCFICSIRKRREYCLITFKWKSKHQVPTCPLLTTKRVRDPCYFLVDIEHTSLSLPRGVLLWWDGLVTAVWETWVSTGSAITPLGRDTLLQLGRCESLSCGLH